MSASFAIPTVDAIAARDPAAALWARVATIARMIEGVDLDNFEAVCRRLIERGETITGNIAVLDLAIDEARAQRVSP